MAATVFSGNKAKEIIMPVAMQRNIRIQPVSKEFLMRTSMFPDIIYNLRPEQRIPSGGGLVHSRLKVFLEMLSLAPGKVLVHFQTDDGGSRENATAVIDVVLIRWSSTYPELQFEYPEGFVHIFRCMIFSAPEILAITRVDSSTEISVAWDNNGDKFVRFLEKEKKK